MQTSNRLNANADIRYVDSFESLQQTCAELATCDWIAVDTEFLREKTYYPKLCLVQIATPEVVRGTSRRAVSRAPKSWPASIHWRSTT